MIKNLVIVESPAKAKTIEGFLGKDFIVKSSFGHVRDLAKSKSKNDLHGLGVDIQNGFLPMYEILDDKKTLVSELKKIAKTAETVWLATDEDREGEAISWHLMEALELIKAKVSIKRIAFHEITKSAITEAIQNPREVDINLVNAQQARRVLDRLVGFELSPLLWKKVKPSLSAGRVQSVAVRLIAEREEEVRGFKVISSYKVSANFDFKDKNYTYHIKAELPHRFENKADAEKFLKQCVGAEFKVENTEIKPSKKSPAPPFTTSTLQQEASRKLGFSVAKTMMVAQQLYESGKITYMRTDSVNLSGLALNMSKMEIESQYGPEYVKIRNYVTRSKGAQEAHEAIRPTYMNSHTIDGDASRKRLYELIWKRTIASQMSDAELEKTNITIGISKSPEKFVARGEVIKFDGFLKVYLESTDDEDDENQKDILPPLKTGELLSLVDILALERFSQHPPRYTEASLVKKLEELGIGRPSTYAPTISTIQKRGYVVNEDRDGFTRSYTSIVLKNDRITEEVKTENAGYEKSKLFPTDIGILVNKFLTKYFDNIIDYNFTANVEKEFDEIAQGQKVWNEVIKEFYFPFHKQIEETTKNSERVSGEKLLGIDPASKKNLYVKVGRYGPVAQIGEASDEEKPRFASLLKGQSIETISLAEALDLFNLPKTVGQYEGKPMQVAIGRFGPYIKCDNAFYSVGKTDNIMSITEARAIEIILEKKEKDSKKLIREFAENKEVKVLNGRWGAYIAAFGKNYKIPKGTTPESLSLQDCIKITETEKGTGTSKKPLKKTSAKATVTKEKAVKPIKKTTTKSVKKTTKVKKAGK
jgi:DNA topoisomerase I